MNARWTPARLVRLLGWPGVLGTGLLVFAATLYLSALRPAASYLDGLRTNVETRQREALRTDATNRDGQTPASQLARFHKAFPTPASLPDWLERIFAVAGNQGIGLDEGDYKVIPDAAGRMVRVQITFPVKSNYPQIRKFISQLKAEIPVVALEHIQFQRQKVADPNVEAQIRLVLFMEPAA